MLGKVSSSISSSERNSSNRLSNISPQESKSNEPKGRSSVTADRLGSDEVTSFNYRLSIIHRSLTKDDRVRIETNNLVLAKVMLANEKNRIGDKLNVLSVSPSAYGATVLMTETSTMTFNPIVDLHEWTHFSIQ